MLMYPNCLSILKRIILPTETSVIPICLLKIPIFFFGWCAVCVDKYAKSEAHEGYKILKSWRDKYHSSTPFTDIVQQEMTQNPLRQLETVKSKPGTCFVYTTNVDGFFGKAGFLDQEICSTHGTYLNWQCSGLPKVKHPFKLFDKPCQNNVWSVPNDFDFQVDISTMSAPPGPPKKVSSQPGWTTNHPTCPYCGQLARPNVYNFGDQCFIENKYEEANCANWIHAVGNIVKNHPETSIVMLEIGVGKRLPKLRVACERLVASLKNNNAFIIRINPDISKGDIGSNVSPIACGALDELRRIDKHLKN